MGIQKWSLNKLNYNNWSFKFDYYTEIFTWKWRNGRFIIQQHFQKVHFSLKQHPGLIVSGSWVWVPLRLDVGQEPVELQSAIGHGVDQALAGFDDADQPRQEDAERHEDGHAEAYAEDLGRHNISLTRIMINGDFLSSGHDPGHIRLLGDCINCLQSHIGW